MRKLLAFVLRDLQIQSNYRIAPIFVVGNILFLILPFFFIGKLIDPRGSPALAEYGGAYFPFVLLGLACSRYLTLSLSFSGIMWGEQAQGTLEALLATPTSAVTIVMGGALWYFLWATIELGLFILLGVVVFHLDLSHANLLTSLILIGLTSFALSGLGMLSACGALLFKQHGDPVNWVLGAFGGFMKLFSGVYFPITLLPPSLQAVVNVLPLTYSLEGLRQAVLYGKSLRQLWEMGLALGLFGLCFWPLALVSLAWTINHLKQTGALNFR